MSVFAVTLENVFDHFSAK